MCMNNYVFDCKVAEKWGIYTVKLNKVSKKESKFFQHLYHTYKSVNLSADRMMSWNTFRVNIWNYIMETKSAVRCDISVAYLDLALDQHAERVRFLKTQNFTGEEIK
eukprot:Pgem_evm2s1457